MIRKLAVAALGLGLLSAAPAYAFDAGRIPQVAQGTMQAAFAPWDDVESLIIDVIGGAKKQIAMQAYLLTSKDIAQALIAAKKRGVDVAVLADAEQLNKNELSKVPELADAGIPVWLETKYLNAHNKVIIIDQAMPEVAVVTGSYNFTWSAQHKNAENILIVRNNPQLAAQYYANWVRHKQDATPYKK